MLKNIFFIVSLFYSTFACADINGDWTGWVDWTFDGSGAHCLSNLSFADDTIQFSRLGGFFDCEIVTMEVSEQILQKSGSDLVLDGVVVGTWKPDFYQWEERYNARTVIHNTIQVEGGHMDYHEEWIEDGTKPLYDIVGRFFHSTN